MPKRFCTNQGSEPAQLPFGGLGLDLAEVRRKVSDLVLMPIPSREEQAQEPYFEAPPPVYGAKLLVLLGRETLGS